MTKSSPARKFRRQALQPAEDYGFFGPGSMTWKVWTYPTVATVGFQRAVVVEEFDPRLIAAVSQTESVIYRSRTRYDRTVAYFALVALGGTREALHAADVLVKIHSKAIGIDPLTGREYDANDPDSQLWILLTGWHSILKMYERYGPGKLSEAEESQYWEECAVAAELQTCDPAAVPRTREGVREYFESMKPKLAGSIVAQEYANYMLTASAVMPPVPRVFKPVHWVIDYMMKAAVVATMPRWMRRMCGVEQSRFVDAAVVLPMRAAHRLLAVSPKISLGALEYLAPSAVKYGGPALLGIEPLSPVVKSPAEARAEHGYPRPIDAHHDWRAKQRAKVFTEGAAPSDAGLIESEAFLGAM